MSMTGSGNEEDATNAPQKLSNEASKVNTETEALKQCSMELNRCFSPMLGLLGRQELLPSILEYEKAMLVTKEHCYARAPERPGVLQLSNVHGKDLGLFNEAHTDSNALLNARIDLLQLRESLDKEKREPSVVCNLREVIGLQIALIREQQEQLHEKDKEMNAVRKEKEQLEARLERMERRLAILQKHSRLKHTDATTTESPLASPTSLTAPNSLTTPIRTHLTRRESIIASELTQSGSVELANRSRSRTSSRANSPNEGSGKRSHKRKLRENEKDEKAPRKKTKHLRELRTEFEYRGLELSVPKHGNGSQAELSPQPNHTDVETTLSGSNVSLIERVSGKVDSESIKTPSWRLCDIIETLTETTSDCEDLSDDVFHKRHKKPEDEEKRRKRWDLQRARTLREHNELLRKYNMKSADKSIDKKEAEKPPSTFIPDLSEIDTIEVMDTVTVSAFGRPLPVIKSSEFELPWFDLDVRDAKESVRKTRSKTKIQKTSAGGSADEL